MSRLSEAIANDPVLSERWADLGITRRKVYHYLCLFCVLEVIYWPCISSYVRFLETEPPTGFGPGDLMKPLVGSCLLSALPFGVLAYRDRTWRSSDAASVICAAWGVVYVGISLQYQDLCPMGVLIPLLPFVFSALVAHRIGTLCQPKINDDTKSTYLH